METALSHRVVVPSHSARILPTRNGNVTTISRPPKIASSTDPTYKEWKPHRKRAVNGKGVVGTDPTYKEWKQTIWLFDQNDELMHGSYLQGMETRQDPLVIP